MDSLSLQTLESQLELFTQGAEIAKTNNTQLLVAKQGIGHFLQSSIQTLNSILQRVKGEVNIPVNSSRLKLLVTFAEQSFFENTRDITANALERIKHDLDQANPPSNPLTLNNHTDKGNS